MRDYTLIIHGWSDCSKSFVEMKKMLQKKEIGDVDSILYGDYQSREDNITFNDVIDGLNDQMIERGLIEPDGKKKVNLNVIVHSTGGLVIRHWIWRYYAHRIEECPVKRVVMLAPANFGSPLAHRGKSFLGRLVKGRWKVGDLLEVGRQLLNGLELASPYQWELAHRDLFSSSNCYYCSDQIQLTILTGINDYAGMRGWVNKPGTDGTIVISGASLNSVKLKLDFSDPSNPHQWNELDTAKDFIFGVLPDLDHGSIVGRFTDEKALVVELTTEALQIETPGEFDTFKKHVQKITDDTYKDHYEKDENKYSRYQQFLIHAVDDHGAPVRDYTFEFDVYKVDKAEAGLVSSQSYFNNLERDYSSRFQSLLLSQVHSHTHDSSFRRLLVNINLLNKLIEETRERLGEFVLIMRIFVPEIDKGIYYDVDSLQNIVIFRTNEKDTKEKVPTLFYANTTTLLELHINRKTKYVRIAPEPVK